jgi:hypothetical protein
MAEVRAHAARVVAPAGLLDLHHVGAEVGQDRAGEGAGKHRADLHHPDACEDGHGATAIPACATTRDHLAISATTNSPYAGRVQGRNVGPFLGHARADVRLRHDTTDQLVRPGYDPGRCAGWREDRAPGVDLEQTSNARRAAQFDGLRPS